MPTEDAMLEQILGLCETLTALARSVRERGLAAGAEWRGTTAAAAVTRLDEEPESART